MAFRDEIQALSGQNVNLCFQCGKCSCGCPLADKMDLKPAQVMHSIRLGRADSVLKSQTIWLCVDCEACVSRCPQQVEPAAAMAAARVLALQKGIKPSLKVIDIYYRGFVDNMRLNGKIHDASVAGITQLLTGQLISDLPLAMKLLRRGRVKLPPLPFGGSKFRKIYRRALAREKESPA